MHYISKKKCCWNRSGIKTSKNKTQWSWLKKRLNTDICSPETLAYLPMEVAEYYESTNFDPEEDLDILKW